MTFQQRLASRQPAPARFTAEEFMALCAHPPISDWAGKVELVEGEIVRMSPAFTQHWNAQRLLTADLTAAFAAAGHEWIVGAEATVKLATGTVRVLDIAVLRAPDLTRRGLLERDALFFAIEIADSTLRNDLGAKLRDYAAGGIPHYWVIDLKKRESHIMSVPEGLSYVERRIVPHGQPISVPGTGSTVTLS